MKQSKTITRLAMVLIAAFISSCIQAQSSDTLQKNEEDQAGAFTINPIGAKFWAENLDVKIINNKGERITLKELVSGGNFNTSIPVTILNSNSSTTLHDFFDKSMASKEEVAKMFVNAVYNDNIEREKDGSFSVGFSADDDERIFNCTNISLSAYYKHPQFKSIYRNLSLYNIRFLNAYAIVETAQPADVPLKVDEIASKNTFLSSIVPEKEKLLTVAQMDSIDDGFDIIPMIVELMNAKAKEIEDADTLDATSTITAFANRFRDIFGYYPPSFVATHKDHIKQENHK